MVGSNICMLEVIYDVGSSPLDWRIYCLLVVLFILPFLIGLPRYRRTAANSIPKTRVHKYKIAAIAYVFVVALLVLWQFSRRNECVMALHRGETQLVRGQFSGYQRVLVPGKYSLKEIKFKIGERTFVEQNAMLHECGLAATFTDGKIPPDGAIVEVDLWGSTILRVKMILDGAKI